MSVVTMNMRGFPPDLNRALKIRAAETGTTVKALVLPYCEEGLERDKKKTKCGLEG